MYLEVTKAMESVMPEHSMIRLTSAALEEVKGLSATFRPHHYAQLANETFSFLEAHGLAALRLQREGTKSVVVAMFGELAYFMKTKSMTADTTDKVCDFLRAMSQEDLQLERISGMGRLVQGTCCMSLLRQ